MLTDSSYFVGDINIPDSSFSNLSTYITRFEKEILLKAFGYELYLLIAAYNTAKPEDSEQRIRDIVEGKEFIYSTYLMKWNGLINSDKKSLIAYYVFFKWLKSHQSSTTNQGEVSSVNENSSKISPGTRLAEAWFNLKELYGDPDQNEMNSSLYNFLKANDDIYPELIFTRIGSFNELGI